MTDGEPNPPAVVRFDKRTVDLDALQRAAYALNQVMTVDIHHEEEGYVCLLYARAVDGDPIRLGHLMRAEVIDQSLRIRIAKDTAPLRDLIFALAFANTGLVLDAADEPPED